MPARFLTFEGLDGSGKSTHLGRAAAWLRARGERVVQTREPGGTPLGDAIRQIFLGHRYREIDSRVEALLVFASRRQHLVQVIEPALAAGQHVLCDRFTDSTRAYQGSGRALGGDFIDALDLLATGGRQPDHTLLFDLPAATARERGQKGHRNQGAGPDRIDVEELAFYDQVREAYLGLARAEPARFHQVDSGGDAESTWRQVEAVLAAIFPAVAGGSQ